MLGVLGLGDLDEAHVVLRKALTLNPWLPERGFLPELQGEPIWDLIWVKILIYIAAGHCFCPQAALGMGLVRTGQTSVAGVMEW